MGKTETTTPVLTNFDAEEMAALDKWLAEQGKTPLDRGAGVRRLAVDELIRMGLLGVR